MLTKDRPTPAFERTADASAQRHQRYCRRPVGRLGSAAKPFED